MMPKRLAVRHTKCNFMGRHKAQLTPSALVTKVGKSPDIS